MHIADALTHIPRKTQFGLLVGGAALIAAAGFVPPLGASANVSASLVSSLPNAVVAEFPLGPTSRMQGGTVTTSTVTKPALPKQKPQASYRVVQTMSGVATAYTSAVEETDGNPFITASGSHVHWGTVACNSLPFGTLVKIKGYGDKIFRVEDRGGSAFTLDIWMQTKAQAFAWGRRNVTFWIVKKV